MSTSAKARRCDSPATPCSGPTTCTSRAGANLRTCFVQGVGDNACTAGRSLTIQSGGEINIGSGISLTAGSGAFRPGGALALFGTAIAVSRRHRHLRFDGGSVGLCRDKFLRSRFALFSAFQASVNAPGAPVTIHGRSVSLTGDVNSAGTDAANPSAGTVDIAATGGAAQSPRERQRERPRQPGREWRERCPAAGQTCAWVASTRAPGHRAPPGRASRVA